MPTDLRGLVPMRWPENWGKPHYREFSHGPVNCIIFEQPAPLAELSAAYARDKITVMALPPATSLVPGAKWPRVQAGGPDVAEAGPTGVPWVDANGYLIQLARALNPDQPAWLNYGPGSAGITPDMVRLSICDAAAYGGHWIVRPELGDWKAIAKTLDFFEQHTPWKAYKPVANLAVVSDFSGANRSLAVETLNLLSRRLIPYRVIPKLQAPDSDLTSFRAILWIDHQPPPREVSSKLNKDALLLQPGGNDPYQVAVETHLKMTRRTDLIRLWNAGSINAHYTGSPDGRTHLVQLLNYSATNSSSEITLGLATPYRSAVLYTLDEPSPKPMLVRRVRAGVELALPPFPVYAALELLA